MILILYAVLLDFSVKMCLLSTVSDFPIILNSF
jgi:hypothetical protein